MTNFIEFVVEICETNSSYQPENILYLFIKSFANLNEKAVTKDVKREGLTWSFKTCRVKSTGYKYYALTPVYLSSFYENHLFNSGSLDLNLPLLLAMMI